ncbi:AraC family transcriptional regulator [Neobacillus drentensis]|uniref:helix-turn-helix transcriptional regulator n=1 Tax=Neobacillus drentensis TaxID=220684 RepID=UPI001F27892B|nr:AraC family transcriptional regulator [Neobacillus drentensis]ULT58999.1 AraC family transcriptional regulator [Neobacillus drentensis]
MKYPYESAVINEEIPMLMLMTSVRYVAMHWHDRIEFLFVLRGQIHVFVGGEEYPLQENDLLLINSNEVHGVESSEDNRVLLLQIPLTFIEKWYENIEKESFECQSFQTDDQERFDHIRMSMIQLMFTLRKRELGYEIKIHSLLLDIVYNLISQFRVTNHKLINRNSSKDIERLTRITSYIQKNYMNPITLNEIAENEELTVPYLSRYFQQHMGQSFVKYLNGIRLEQAVMYLLETNWPVIQIAMESGFSSLNTFHKLFKDTFHTTPYQFRKNQQKTLGNSLKNEAKGIESYEYTEEVDLNELEKYSESRNDSRPRGNN